MFASIPEAAHRDMDCPPAAKVSSAKLPMRWPLRYQILFPFAGLFVAVIVAITAIDTYLAAHASQRQIEAQLREVAHTLLTSSFPLTKSVLEQTRGLSGAEFVVTLPDGSIADSSMPVRQIAIAKNPIAQWQKLQLGTREMVGDETYFHTALKLTGRTERAEPGLLHILYPEKVWREARWQAVYPPLTVGFVSLIAVGAVAFAIAGRMSRPITSLRAQVGELARGNFQTVSLPTHNDELRDLVDSVNKLAEQLDEMRRVIKRTERLTLLGQLSGGLAHHLRNDVTGARIAIQLHGGDGSAEDAEALSVALRQLTLAEQHLQQFLAAGQPRPPQRVVCKLRDLIENLVLLIGPTCKHHRVTLQTHFVASVSPDQTVEVDAEQLRQCLLNLLLNAIEAAGPGGWIRIECDSTNVQSIRLRILDSGPGVPTPQLQHLFEPFSTSKPEGVGLGLTVARQIAEAHGGKLQYSREAATCFEVTLPTRHVPESLQSSSLESARSERCPVQV
jgi:signal transduction histidine kinase